METLDPFLDQVISAIAGSFAATKNPIDAVAESMTMSRRTFQRNLSRRGTSFHLLREGVRRRLATELLGDRRVSSREVARALGYAGMSSFHRAFRRWTGTTPMAYAIERELERRALGSTELDTSEMDGALAAAS